MQKAVVIISLLVGLMTLWLLVEARVKPKTNNTDTDSPVEIK